MCTHTDEVNNVQLAKPQRENSVVVIGGGLRVTGQFHSRLQVAGEQVRELAHSASLCERQGTQGCK